MTVRRKARELTLQILFQKEFAGDLDLKSQLENFKQSFSFSADVWKYAETLLNGLKLHQQEIDQIIDNKSQNWSSQRMALVDRNILRIAIFEIIYLNGEIPPKVATNEAIEISKKYSGTDSHQFINGILGHIVEAKTT